MSEIFVFDWGGVLIRGFSDMYTKLAEDMNCSSDVVREALLSQPYMRGEVTYEQWVTELRDKLSSGSDLQEFSDNICINYFYKYVQLDEDVFRILNRIKEEKKCPVVALSNTSDIIIWVIKNKFPGLYYSFLRLYLSYEMKCLKPEPQIYREMTEDLSVDPSELIFIDDRVENVQAAIAQGINSILFRSAVELERVLFK